jgi:hypothetical protein
LWLRTWQLLDSWLFKLLLLLLCKTMLIRNGGQRLKS